MAEILHQLIGSLSHYLQGFIHPRWLAGFLPSTVFLSWVVQPPTSDAEKMGTPPVFGQALEGYQAIGQANGIKVTQDPLGMVCKHSPTVGECLIFLLGGLVGKYTNPINFLHLVDLYGKCMRYTTH